MLRLDVAHATNKVIKLANVRTVVVVVVIVVVCLNAPAQVVVKALEGIGMPIIDEIVQGPASRRWPRAQIERHYHQKCRSSAASRGSGSGGHGCNGRLRLLTLAIPCNVAGLTALEARTFTDLGPWFLAVARSVVLAAAIHATGLALSRVARWRWLTIFLRKLPWRCHRPLAFRLNAGLPATAKICSRTSGSSTFSSISAGIAGQETVSSSSSSSSSPAS